MRIKNRLSSYPILNNFGDDYVDSSFEVEYELSTQFSEVYGKLTFSINNNEIKLLIEQGRALYSVHIECPSTCYRTSISSQDSEVEFKIDARNISKVIEIRTFVVLSEDLADFFSEKFHPDYQNQVFSLSKHQIIAVGTAKNYEIKKDDRDMDSLPSILRIVKLKDKKKGTLSVNTDADSHIIVGLEESVFELYANLGKSTYKASAFSLVLLPALIIVLQRMCVLKDDEVVSSYHWYKVIENMLNDNNITIENMSIENDSLLTVCQSIFSDPIGRSFNELNLISERM